MRLINCRTWILLGAVVMNDSAYAAFPSLDSDGNFNSGVGTLTLQFVSGSMNTASGDHALFSDTTGSLNTANGAGALQSNTTANNNTANAIDFEPLAVPEPGSTLTVTYHVQCLP